MTNARFLLTRRAADDLRAIHRHSLEEWGEETARAYMAKLYAAMTAVAERPETGLLRRHRSAPFRMVPAGRHFVVYDATDIGAVILTILHQRRDIERIIAGFTPDFMEQVAALRRDAKTKL